MALVWSDSCIPPVSNATLDAEYKECCSARFLFSTTGAVVPGPSGTYYPNKCTASPTTPGVVIGPMKIDMEIVSDSIAVDDELLVNGVVYEPGQHLVVLGSGTTAFGDSFGGGTSLCNGFHLVDAGKVLATVPQGESVTLAGGDNHGIGLLMTGAVIVRPVLAP